VGHCRSPLVGCQPGAEPPRRFLVPFRLVPFRLVPLTLRPFRLPPTVALRPPRRIVDLPPLKKPAIVLWAERRKRQRAKSWRTRGRSPLLGLFVPQTPRKLTAPGQENA
jgi:hypothetical protein